MNKRVCLARVTTLVTVLMGMALVQSCGPAAPDRPAGPDATIEDVDYDPIALGRTHYLRYCASCHGQDGRGNGPVAEVLKEAPTDITQMRADGDGVFNVDSLIEIIRGLKDVRAHGTREMPVWGNIWGDVGVQSSTPSQIEKRINELVEYIRSIQEPVDQPS